MLSSQKLHVALKAEVQIKIINIDQGGREEGKLQLIKKGWVTYRES